ncbi:type II toxin-antitoxin system RelE/ParE family toxin [Lactobacillus sp. ESL0230]|uniref:type II toxin-antitoxin system RelE/ParE family toxin n=1 Tax=Lactobacillus sp. ESL0230 TaxID=2069353 RepID=UPI000EFD4830|nr:type II toxin-antitoxin system RelE/ParE family toxin [Lactobacillus sp. ESL0230]RMC46120.1 hypothetical protein F5ESL0230_02370 [Lactobacillus sp. ESL0230]
MNKLDLTFGYLPSFNKKWKRYNLTANDKKDLENQILQYVCNAPSNNYGRKFPGSIIEETSGAYKLRFAPKASNTGKSGSYRTIYVAVANSNVYFLDIYAKKDQANISNSDKALLKSVIRKLKENKQQ